MKGLRFIKNSNEIIGKLKECINNLNNYLKGNGFFYWKYFKVFAIVTILILCSFGVIYGSVSTKESEIIKKVSIALNSGNERKLSKLIRVNNNKVKLSAKDLEPLIRFYEEDPSRISNLISALKNGEELYSLKIIKDDGVFNNRYYLEIILREVEIVSNFPNSKVYIDSEYKGEINSSNVIVLKDMVPGIYNLKVENKCEYSSLKAEKIINFSENEKINIPLEGIMITLYSNFPDGIVYIDGNNSQKMVSEFVNIGPFNKNGSNELLVKAKTPWGELSSESVIIENLPEIKLNIDLKAEGIISEIETTVKDFYNSVFVALNSQNKEDILYSTDEVKNQVYDILNKKYFIFKNKYEISDLDLRIENSEVEYINEEYIGNIVINISYKVRKAILGLNIKEDSYNESFFTKVKYVNGKWVVYQIDNFSISGIKQ